MLTARWLFLGSAVLLFANVAFGGGTYQRTKNGKTLVWNNGPKPGDEASWWGDRDREGYAKGFGTLTWYTAQRQSEAGSGKSTLYARYWGNMVRGKFNGPVNVHSKGKTDYAIFADGVRTTRWAVGPAPSWRVAPPPTKPAKPETPAERASAEGSRMAGPEAPAKGPPRGQRSEVRGQTSEITDRPTAPTVGKKREEPVRPQAETEAAAPAEGPSVQTSASGPASGSVEPTARKEGPPPRREDRGQRSAYGLQEPTPRPADRAVPESAAAEKPKPEIDDSLQQLVGPPPSLRMGAASDGSPAAASPEAVSSPAANVRLTEEEVVDLADAAARSRGYDPAQYWRPDPHYNPAAKTWSLVYDQKAHYATGGIVKHFTVTVDNKTKGTVFVPGK